MDGVKECQWVCGLGSSFTQAGRGACVCQDGGCAPTRGSDPLAAEQWEGHKPPEKSQSKMGGRAAYGFRLFSQEELHLNLLLMTWVHPYWPTLGA